ncbi:hypothetical protein JXB01_02465 [Candidatus Micrarchaeota archaeon]|nr:hypothetical protein [Candidatus Micrarchaeota archaeon]
MLESFKSFVGRVMDSVKTLNPNDRKKLGNILKKEGSRNLVLAKGLLTALDTKSPSKNDIIILADLFDNANKKINDGKKPFTGEEKKKIASILRKYGMAPKVNEWVISQTTDPVLYEALGDAANENIGRKTLVVTKKLAEKKKKKRKA